MLDNLVDYSDLEYPAMLHPNDQKQCNFRPNLEDKPMDIEINLEEFPKISQ